MYKHSTNDNTGNKSNAKGFNRGSVPPKFGPSDLSSEEKNVIGGTEDANRQKKSAQTVNKSLKTPKEPVLNAVSMPNKKGREVNKSILTVSGDEAKGYKNCGACNGIPVGGTPRPNKIS